MNCWSRRCDDLHLRSLLAKQAANSITISQGRLT